MSRHWSVRVFRAFLALWFVLSVGEPSVVHFCPMHGGLLGELRGMPPMADMPGMAGMRMSTDGAHRRSGSRSQPHHCTCIDSCVGAGAAAVLPPMHVAIAPVAWTATAIPIVATAEILPRPAPPHAQPPGTGPPRT